MVNLSNLICFEDEHLLVVNKPPGMNTHSPNPYAGEGLYDWLKHREPRWNRLAILHRLDKETSGVLVFGKTTVANQSLTQQFTRHGVRKKYLLVTDRIVRRSRFTVISALVRAGDRYLSRPLHAGRVRAETRFRVVTVADGKTLVEAEPVTGRTHQIRVHAAAEGFAILGDTLYGGTPAARVCLHAEQLTFEHPVTHGEVKICGLADFEADPRLVLRAALFDPNVTNAQRLVHSAADGCARWHVDRFGDFLLSQSERFPDSVQRTLLAKWMKQFSAAGVYHKTISRSVRETNVVQASPQWILGEIAPDKFLVRENGLKFELSFQEGYSTGLFLDQRDNRRRFLVNYVAADFPLFPDGARGKEILNTFAYTCSYSVCAAKAGARVTSLDLSRKYLEWGERNFSLNDLDPGKHDFIYGDVFDWLRRFARKTRRFDAIILDPPTFSTSKAHGVFRVESDYGELIGLALPLLKSNGVLFASTNSAKINPEKFLATIAAAIHSGHRKVLQQHYVPQPPDFPITHSEPAYLKTVWLRIA
ncbi:MAG: pseudouridine synthase [Verrucomicrobiota bacterium]